MAILGKETKNPDDPPHVHIQGSDMRPKFKHGARDMHNLIGLGQGVIPPILEPLSQLQSLLLGDNMSELCKMYFQKSNSFSGWYELSHFPFSHHETLAKDIPTPWGPLFLKTWSKEED